MVHSAAQNVAASLQQMNQQAAAHNHSPSQQQSLTPAQAVQQQLRLQRLQLEQDRLRQRQQEIIAMVTSRTLPNHHEANLNILF